MTAKEIFSKAMILLGYISSNGDLSGEREFLKKGVVAINQIYADLFYALENDGFKEISSLNDNVDLPERLLCDVMPYGVAMLIAQGEDDGDSQQLFSQIYNKKRKSVRTENKIIDLLPRGSDM